MKVLALVVLFFMVSCSAETNKPQDPLDQAIDNTWTVLSPYLGGLICLVFCIYILRGVVDMFFPEFIDKTVSSLRKRKK